MKSLIVVIALIAICPAVTQAKNIYVSAKTGNDKFNGSSPQKAKRTIQAAADKTHPGDTVFVMSGTYTNACNQCDVLDVHKSGQPNHPIVFMGYRQERPVIRFDAWAGIAIKNSASYIKIAGFEVVGCAARLKLADALKQPQSCENRSGAVEPKYNGAGIVVEGLGKWHSHHITISDNIVHDCSGGGIGASHADYIYIQGNTVYNTSMYTIYGTSGIALYQFWNYDKAPVYHNIISRNKCYNNRSLVPWMKLCKIYDGNGIIIDDFRNRQNGSKLGPYRSRTLVENNICWYNGGTGIHSFQSDHIDILNNTAYCNSRSKEYNPGQILSGMGTDNRIVNNILVADSGSAINYNYANRNLTYQNNLHYNITYPGKEQVHVNSKTCLNGEDPLFVAAANSLTANFELKPNSPALRHANRGLHSDRDIEGIKRGSKHPPSIGAYED